MTLNCTYAHDTKLHLRAWHWIAAWQAGLPLGPSPSSCGCDVSLHTKTFTTRCVSLPSGLATFYTNPSVAWWVLLPSAFASSPASPSVAWCVYYLLFCKLACTPIHCMVSVFTFYFCKLARKPTFHKVRVFTCCFCKLAHKTIRDQACPLFLFSFLSSANLHTAQFKVCPLDLFQKLFPRSFNRSNPWIPIVPNQFNRSNP
jgi:hypothetical protein